MIKIQSELLGISCLAALLAAAGCSHAPAQNAGAVASNHDLTARDLNNNGPTVIDTAPEPVVISLNSALQPSQPAIISADVKDFKSTITDVRLKFRDIPLELPMSYYGGTTWRAELTPPQLQMLAVSGKTMQYQADIIARDANGSEQSSRRGVTLAVKAPEIGPRAG